MSAQYFMNENLFFYKNIHVIILQCNGIIFFKIELIGKCIIIRIVAPPYIPSLHSPMQNNFSFRIPYRESIRPVQCSVLHRIFINFPLMKHILTIVFKRIYFNITVHLNSISIRRKKSMIPLIISIFKS